MAQATTKDESWLEAREALTRIEVHERVCGERYKESTDALLRLHARIDGLNKVNVGILVSALMAAATEIYRLWMAMHP